MNSTRCVFHDNGSYSTLCWYATDHFCFFLSFDEGFSISTYFLFLVNYWLISYLGNFRATDHDGGIPLCLCTQTHSNGTLFTGGNGTLTYCNICHFLSFCQLTHCYRGFCSLSMITYSNSGFFRIGSVTSSHSCFFCTRSSTCSNRIITLCFRTHTNGYCSLRIRYYRGPRTNRCSTKGTFSNDRVCTNRHAQRGSRVGLHTDYG